MRVHLLLSILLFSSLGIAAQDDPSKEVKEIYFSVEAVFSRHDSLIAMIRGGTNEGIRKGLIGKCNNILHKGINEDFTELGSFEIIAVTPQNSFALINLYKKGSFKDSVRAGDVAILNVSIPAKPSRTLLYELASVNIEFADMYKENLYTISDLIQYDSQEFEDSIISRFVDDIRYTYESLHEDLKDNLALNNKLKGGRYRGKSVFDVMRDVTPADVIDFLLFARSYTFSYMGKNYKANETFATWVLNLAPPGARELERKMLNPPPGFDLISFAKLYDSTVRGDVTISLAEAAVNRFDAGEKEKAQKMMAGLRTVIDALDDTLGYSAWYLNAAQMEQNAERYREAITFSDSAFRYASLIQNGDYELRALFKKIYCQYKASDYRGGRETVALASETMNKYEQSLSASQYTENRRKELEYAAMIDYAAGDYQKSLDMFREAIAFNNQTGTYTAQVNNASNYWYIGKIFLNQADYQAALVAYDSSLQFYRNINNRYWIGYTINEIGYTLFKMLDYEKSMQKHQEAYDILMAENSYNNAGYAKSMIGQCLWNLGRHNEAIESHHQAIALRRKADNHDGEAFSWEKLGNLYELSGEKTKALSAFDSAAWHYSIINDSASIAKNYNNIAKVYENDNDLLTALGYYERALVFLRNIESKDGLINTLYNLGMVSFDVDTIKSRKYFQECLELSVNTGDKTNQMYSLINLGALSSNNSDVARQQEYYRQALALSREINTPDMEAFCYGRMGAGYERQLEFERAVEHYNKAMNIYDTVDKKKYLTYLIYRGNTEITMGDYAKAEESFHNAVSVAKSTESKLELGDALTSIAFLYTLQGEFAKAMTATDSAASIFESTGNNIKLASAYQTYGSLYKGMGEFSKSIRSLLRADSIYVAEKKEFYRSNVNINIGVTYFFQADYQKALEYFRKVEATLRDDVVDETWLLIKGNIAECHYYLGDPAKAEEILSVAYPMAKSKGVNRIALYMGVLMGRMRYDAKRYEEAADYLSSGIEQGYRSGQKEFLIEGLMYLGKTRLAQQRESEAGDHLREAARITRQYNITTYGWEALYELGLYHYLRSEWDSAVLAFQDAVEIVEKNSENIYGGEEAKKIFQSSGKKVDLYSKLVTSLAKAGNTQDAWVYANRYNITAIRELQGGAVAGDADKTAAINQANTLLQQKAAIDKSINDLENKAGSNEAQLQTLQQKKAVVEKEYLNYITNLIKKYPDLRLYFAQGVNPEQFKNYKNKLPADAAAVLYLINDAQLLIFTVTNQKIGIKIIELQEDIDKLLEDFVGVMNVPGKASGTGSLTLRSKILRERKEGSGVTFTGTSEKLYNLLIGEIEEEIKGKKQICIIPSGKLCNIPFQCLGQRMADSSFRFMVEDYSIFYTNTLDIFLNSDETEKDFSSFAAFGNPDKSLASAKTEVLEIGKILNLNAVYTEDEATELKAKEALSTNRYVHFATHGILDYTDFSKSYLQFAPNGGEVPEDGMLTIEEMKSLDITGCDLVALSACETAVSQELEKGWYVSPANSLLINNVKSVVASLWSVDDAATSILLKEFYSNLRTMSKAEALRKAQETLSRDPRYVHPFYWGAFVLYGDWR